LKATYQTGFSPTAAVTSKLWRASIIGKRKARRRELESLGGACIYLINPPEYDL